MRRRQVAQLRSWPDPPPELLSGRIADWVRPEDWPAAEKAMAITRYYPEWPLEDRVREHVWMAARLRWCRARGRWLDEHNVPGRRESEAVPFRWPSGGSGDFSPP